MYNNNNNNFNKVNKIGILQIKHYCKINHKNQLYNNSKNNKDLHFNFNRK